MLHEDAGLAYAVLTAAGVTHEAIRAAAEATVGTGALGDADAEALQAIGIDLPTVRAKIEEVFGPGALEPPCPDPPRRGLLRRRAHQPAGPNRHRPFTLRSKKVLELSLREAVHLRHGYIGSEHLLLGLLREGEGLAARFLTEAGLSLDVLREQTVAALDRAA